MLIQNLFTLFLGVCGVPLKTFLTCPSSSQTFAGRKMRLYLPCCRPSILSVFVLVANRGLYLLNIPYAEISSGRVRQLPLPPLGYNFGMSYPTYPLRRSASTPSNLPLTWNRKTSIPYVCPAFLFSFSNT